MFVTDLKALVVVIALALVVFAVARPILVDLIGEKSYTFRRNVWLFLTCLGFLAPTFALYVVVAAPVLYWAGQRDSNPPALFALLIFVVPPVSIQIPGLVVEQLFALSHIRLMLLMVLLPHVLRIVTKSPVHDGVRLRGADWCLLAYIGLNIYLMWPYQSYTVSMREAFLLVVDLTLLFYAFGRLSWSKRMLTDAVASLALAGLVLAPIAMFETAKGWLLFTGITARWGDSNRFAWLFRGELLRAQGPTGHSLQLGYMLAICLAFMLYVHSRTQYRTRAIAGMLMIAGGMVATLARGPWLAAAVSLLVALALASGGTVAFIRTLSIVGAGACLVLISPAGDTVIEHLPFVGSVGSETVAYRRLLLDTSLAVIAQNPLLGSPTFGSQMEHLRQGQGIIDIVNGYLLAALRFGIVGMVLFSGTMLLALWGSFWGWRQVRALDEDLRRLGGVLVGCALGTLLFVATAGPGPITYLVCGLAASYADLAVRTSAIRRRQQVTGTGSLPLSKALATPIRRGNR